jgi:hypothetical protein
MSFISWKRLGIAVAVLALIGGGYYAWMMMPGGVLPGNVTVVPAEWSVAQVPKVVRLETNPAAPYSVKIWVVPMGASLYVHAGANHTQWVKHLESNSAARMLMQDRLYELSAARVTDAAEFATFSDAYERRYGRRPRNENISEVYVYRLAPRNNASG